MNQTVDIVDVDRPDLSIKTNTFARMSIDRCLDRTVQRDVIQKPVFGSIALTAAPNLNDPAQGPPPPENPQGGSGTPIQFPINEFPTSVGLPLPATVEGPAPQATPTMYYQPGIFPPLTVPIVDGANPDFNTTGKNTFVQAFGVRRGWLVDTDANLNAPETLGIQPSEFSLQFLSARQETTRLQTASRIYPRFSKAEDLRVNGLVQRLTNGLYVDSFQPPRPELRVFGTFVNVNDDLTDVLPPIDAGPATLQAGQDRWGGPMRFGLPESGPNCFTSPGGHVPSLEYTSAAGEQISLQDYIMTPFAFDGEFLSHTLARQSLDANVPYPFVFSKSTRGSHSYENNPSAFKPISPPIPPG